METKLNDICENQSKLITNRITLTEKNFIGLIDALSSLNNKESRSRDKLDDISAVLQAWSLASESESEKSLLLYSELGKSFCHIADLRTLQTLRYEEKIQELMQYDYICKNAREEVKNLTSIMEKEITKRKNIDDQKKSRMENELLLSNLQISKLLKELLAVAENFEKQRLCDMKEIFTDLILIQMKCMTSSLEVLQSAYKSVSAFDEKSELEVSFIINNQFFHEFLKIQFFFTRKPFVMDVKKQNRVYFL
jgi:hypothetical protein